MWIIIASITFFALGYAYGFYMRNILDKLKRVAAKAKREPKPQTPQSSIIEPPLTPAERVQRDQEELLERLNPSE